MADQEPPSSENMDEKTLLAGQALKYAQDIVQVYEEEKAKRNQLEKANTLLREEIDRRRQVEDALRQSEERFRTIFEAAQDCIYIKDHDGRYTHVNPAMESLLQLPQSRIIGRTDIDLFGKEAGAHLMQVDRRVLSGDTIEEEHARPVHGIPTTFLDSKVPLRNAAGEIVALCGIARNVTDRRRPAMMAGTSRSDHGDYPSKAMRAALAQAKLVARQASLVLLLGESGAGKDFMARYIHDNSERSSGPFFAINCASVAPELAESELFGHEAGAFTGAKVRKRGLVELAEGGSLFLNEIGELTQPLQAKLLTFLDTRSFARVGGEKNLTVNARIIAATNRDLKQDAEEGRFRRDLYYRLNVLAIKIPPLRERSEDIPVLVHRILLQLLDEIRLKAPPTLDEEAMLALRGYPWPGNVRELRNVLERALILSGGGRIGRTSLGLEPAREEWTFIAPFPESESLNDVVSTLKRSLVLEALRRTGGNRSEAARLLGISRNSLNHYLESLNIDA